MGLGKPPLECVLKVTEDLFQEVQGVGDVPSGHSGMNSGALDSRRDDFLTQVSVDGNEILPTIQDSTETTKGQTNVDPRCVSGHIHTKELFLSVDSTTSLGMNHTIVETVDETVEGMEVRQVPEESTIWLKTYGTLTCGAELMHTAWPKLEHVFSICRENEVGMSLDDSTQIRMGPRPPKNLLRARPVDLLVVERGFITRPRKTPHPEEWESLVDVAGAKMAPKVVLESWCAQAVNWENGPTGKASRIRWERLGYESRFRRVSAIEVGGALSQS